MTKTGVFYRSGLVGIINLLRRNIITAEHIEAARDTPFYTFLKTSFDVRNENQKLKKFHNLIEEICSFYDVKRKAFKIGRKYVKLTTKDVKAIFGLKHGNEEMPLNKTGAFIGRFADGAENDSMLMQKYFLSPRTRRSGPTNDNSLSNALIKESIEKAIRDGGEDEAKDVARLLILFICSTLFFSVSGDVVGWTAVFYIENLEKINDYDWSRAIVEKLQKSLDKCIKAGNPGRVVGCVALLFPFLMEHSFIDVEIPRPNIIPRCYKWWGLERKESTFEMILMVSQLRDAKVMDDEVSLTEAECEAFGENDNLSPQIFGERDVELMDDLSPQIFWANVSEGKAPEWKYIANSSARNRKRVQNLDDPLNICPATSDELAKKRKKVGGDSNNLPPCGDGMLDNGSDNVMVDTEETCFVIPPGQIKKENAALDTMVSEGAMVDGVIECSGASSPGDATNNLVPTYDSVVEDDLVRVMSDGIAGSDVLGVVASGSSQGNALKASCSSQLQILNEVSKPSRETLTAAGTTNLTEAAENTMASTSLFSKDNISNGTKSFVPDESPLIHPSNHAVYDDVILEMHDIEAGSPVPTVPSNANPPCNDFPTAIKCMPQSSNRDIFTYQISGTSTQQVEPIVPPPASIAGHAPADPLFCELGTTVSDARIAVTSPLHNYPNLQTASQIPLSLYTNPFEYEMERILKELDQTTKTHIDFNEVLTSEYQKEMDQVHMKYATKQKEEETNFQLKKKELHARYNKVHMHKTLVADAFKSLSQINQK